MVRFLLITDKAIMNELNSKRKKERNRINGVAIQNKIFKKL